jgi:hypothetical protein
MATHKFTESIVEDVALARLEALGYAVLYGPDIVADVVLRDTLLPKLISGKLRVNDAECVAVEDVTAPMQPDQALHR